MISFNWNIFKDDTAHLIQAFDKLPRHIGKKHLLASMKAAIRAAKGVQVLKALTPKAKTRTVRSGITRDERKGTFSKGSQGWGKQKGGAMRRAVTVNARYIGRNKDGVAVATLGYKYGAESKKAIFLEYGTSRGIEPRRMVDKAMKSIHGPLLGALGNAMAQALDKASKELSYGKNPGKRY
jgi:hypothetical protein